ncbi:membrane-spanning 4-domains subfamily A member 4A-like [Engystomops pustulosus]|uniref:membrane-spanning 4-domains subfamily A member 4A-like n=1 Tax=Engystomops pustulosus TaxID=76066 RepID=UPI003AFB3287
MSTTNNENSPPGYTPQSPAPTSVPTYIQNVPSPYPGYNASSPAQAWNVATGPPQWNVAAIVAPNTDPSSPFFTTFLRGKPKALGIVMIVAAILEIALGIGLIYTTFTITRISGIPFWGSVCYIIAGILSIAAQAKPNSCLVRGSLAMHILSCIFLVPALIIGSLDLVLIPLFAYCDYSSDENGDGYRRCMSRQDAAYGVGAVLLIINLLLFCVSLSLSIFGCRSLSYVYSYAPQVFLIQNGHVPSMNPSTVTSSGFTPPYAPAAAPPPPYVTQGVKAPPV